MAQPKRKTSKSRKNNRRRHHSVKEPALAQCSNCGEYHKYHHVCNECGFYRGRQVLNVNN